MAITYHAGRRIQGLEYTASNITKDEDFSSVWNGVGSNISITGGSITANSVVTQSENRLYYPLGFTLADDFVVQFDFEQTALSSGAHYMLLTLTAGSGHISNGNNQDAIQVWVDMGSPTFYLRDKDGTTTGTNTSSLTISNSTRYYVTLVNNNRTVTYTLRTGSHTGTTVGTNSITLQSGITGLTHVQSGTFSGNSGTASYTLDNLKIWNDTTSSSGTPTFEDDFSSSDVWVKSPNDSQFAVSYSESNTNVNDVAHFEGTVGANYVIGEQITSGNKFIGRTVNSISFWLYKLNSGSSGTETFTFGIWDSSGNLQKDFGSITRGEIPQGSSYSDGQRFTKTDSTGYVLQQNDIVGLRTNSNPNSAWTVEITQRDSNVYSNGQRAVFTQGSTPTTSTKDIGFEIGSTDGRLDFLENASSGGDRCWYDLGASAVSSTKWVFRTKFRFTTIATQSAYPEFDFGLSDNTVNSDTQQNFMGFRCLPMAANNLFRPRVCDGGSGDSGKPRRGSSADHTLSPAFTTGKDYFVEIKRTSASNWSASLSNTNAFDGDIYSGSFTDASSVTDLRYIKIMDGTTATSADMEGYVDDVEFYNDTTTAVKTAIGDEKPTNVQVGSRYEETDTRKMYSLEIAPTYEDDFSSYADQTAADAAWVSNDTADFRVNITNDNFAFDSKVTSTTNTGAYYDLGTALSDTAWVVDFKMVISTLTLYSSGSVGAATYITMNNSGTGGAIGGTVDAIGFYMSSTASGGRFEMTKADGSALNIGGGTLTTINATGTYYVRIIRLSSTSMRLELYSDPGRSTLIEGKTRTDVASTTTGLRYFRIQDNQSSAGTGTGQQIGTIDDIKIYNGVTSPSSSTNYAWQEIGT